MRGLLFDKDGTLLDFEASWATAFRELCLDLCAGDIKAAEGMLERGGMDPATDKFAAGSVLAAGNTLDVARLWYPQLSGDAFRQMVERLDRAFHANGVRYSVLLPGVRETLGTLHDHGFALGVATSDGTAATRAALQALGLDTRFRHVFGYDSVPQPKPAPDMVHAFCAATGLSPHETVVIGDNVHDLEMGRRAGAGAAIGVLSGNGTAEDFGELADAVLESICDLPTWLDTQGARDRYGSGNATRR